MLDRKGKRKEGKPAPFGRKWRSFFKKRNVTLLPFLCSPEGIKKPILIKAKQMLFSRELYHILLEVIIEWNSPKITEGLSINTFSLILLINS